MPVRVMQAGLTCWPRSATEAPVRASMAGVRRAGSVKVVERTARSSGGARYEAVDGVLQGRPQIG